MSEEIQEVTEIEEIPVLNLGLPEAEEASPINYDDLGFDPTPPPPQQVFEAEADPHVFATGSVWTLHYEGDRAPDEKTVARALAVLGVVRVQHVSTTGVAPVIPTLDNTKESN